MPLASDIPAYPIWLDYAGVLVFAATGALAAARRKYDLVTFAFFAAITGIGGGTLRDLLIGAPVFWVRDSGYFLASLAAAVAVWFVGHRRGLYAGLLWLDAFGSAAYAIVGAAKAAAYGVPGPVCVVMGGLTASFGGVIRDVLAGEPSVLLKREITISAALVAAALFIVLHWLGVQAVVAGIVGAVAGFVLRGGAIRWGWSLPAFRGFTPKPTAEEHT